MPRPGRHVEGARTRERVLEAAAALIAEQGYAATSIAQISQRSKANPASIYWAFGSKEGLFAAVMERAAASFFTTLAPPRRGDPWSWLAAQAAAFAEGPEFLRLLLVLSLERRAGDPLVLEAARRVRTYASDALATFYAEAFAISDPLRHRAVCEPLARFTLMLLDGVFVASRIEPDTTDLHRAFETIAIAARATGEQLLARAGSAPSAVASSKARKGVPR